MCAVCIRSHDGGIPGKKALPLHAFVTAKNVHSGWLGIHDPTCVPRTDGRSWINYTKAEGGGGRRRDGRTRFRVSRSWASLFLLPALSTYGEASSIQGRGLVDSWNRFSLFVFMRFLYYRKREDLSWNCNIRKVEGKARRYFENPSSVTLLYRRCCYIRGLLIVDLLPY